MPAKLLKSLVFLICLLPLAVLAWRGWHDHLGANPVETITRETGLWTLRLLLITLLVTPLRRLTGWNGALKLRRMLGLFAFFYAVLHFITYIWLDQFFIWDDMVHDVMKRPFITVGFAGFVLLLPLAATSSNAMMKRLGRRWKVLHRLTYLIPALGVLHYLWLVKADIGPPLLYGTLLCVLLGVRMTWVRTGTAFLRHQAQEWRTTGNLPAQRDAEIQHIKRTVGDDMPDVQAAAQQQQAHP